MRRVPASRCWPDGARLTEATPLARLRAATAAVHDEAERGFDWRARVGTLEGYRDTLAALYGFHAAWEPLLARTLDDPAFFDGRRRLHLLRDDLLHLGLFPAELDALPRPMMPVLPGRGAALGSLYVVEGSRLGGQLIARHVQSALGLRAGAGLSYHGAAAGPSWRLLCERLDAELPAPAELEEAVTAALDTFACLGGVLARAGKRSVSA